MVDNQNPGDEIEGGFSLADLIDLDVSDIAEVRFSTLSPGVYEFEIIESGLLEDTDTDGNRRFKAEVTMKVVGVKAVLEAGVDKESLIDKLHTERMFIKPLDPQADVLKQVGRIRAFVADVGMDSKGKLGDIVANLKGHTFTTTVTAQPDKNDKSRTYARLKLEDSSKRNGG